MKFEAFKTNDVRHTAYYLTSYPRELGNLQEFFEGSKEFKRPLDELKHYAKNKGCNVLVVYRGRNETKYVLKKEDKNNV